VVLEVIVLTQVTNNTPLKAKTTEKVIKITTLTREDVLMPLKEENSTIVESIIIILTITNMKMSEFFLVRLMDK
jgi:hypothetical protein